MRVAVAILMVVALGQLAMNPPGEWLGPMHLVILGLWAATAILALVIIPRLFRNIP